MKGNSGNLKLIIQGAIVIFAFFWANKIMKSVFAFFGEQNTEHEQENAKNELKEVEKEIKYNYLSHQTSRYYTLADSIEVALQASWNEDEQAIYNVFKAIWNNSDFLMLKKAFGQRPIGIYGFRTPMTMEKAIRYYLNNEEVGTINHILKKQKGGYVTLRV